MAAFVVALVYLLGPFHVQLCTAAYAQVDDGCKPVETSSLSSRHRSSNPPQMGQGGGKNCFLNEQ